MSCIVTQNASFQLIGSTAAYLRGTVHCNKCIMVKYTSWPERKQRNDTLHICYNFPFVTLLNIEWYKVLAPVRKNRLRIKIHTSADPEKYEGLIGSGLYSAWTLGFQNREFNHLKHNGYYMHQQVSHSKNLNSAHSVFMSFVQFHMRNRDYFPAQN
jgi:hypothetical protein